jgi:hypothetical protein
MQTAYNPRVCSRNELDTALSPVHSAEPKRSATNTAVQLPGKQREHKHQAQRNQGTTSPFTFASNVDKCNTCCFHARVIHAACSVRQQGNIMYATVANDHPCPTAL